MFLKFITVETQVTRRTLIITACLTLGKVGTIGHQLTICQHVQVQYQML